MIKTLLISTLMATYLNVHDTAPDFLAADCDSQSQSLAKLVEKGPVILVFFPKAFTSGCTQELTAFAQNFEQVKKRGAQVVAISADSAETLQKFRDEIKAPYLFIPDPKGSIMRLYQVKTPLVTFAKRTTFVIDRKRNIVRIDEGAGAVKAQSAIDALDKMGLEGL